MKITTTVDKETVTTTANVLHFNLTLTLEEAQRVAAMIGSFTGGTYHIYSDLDDAIKDAGEDSLAFCMKKNGYGGLTLVRNATP